ncbi:hypothetical protein BC939DRAFT_475822 [Gamsiella multidivaricata]|uniref:uncharacterized protein n=1 Tax=Gamsiella multidivaricata TaxID=101098 RepID=UPI00221E6231|nr:uncharacterized protein BC939DRAFT_475822 [Gamsiella multidivaricata]KAI7826120.1 hypothetical protein BC939DRAFT_475822 [Gamsiella multidivaricata]
MDHFYRFGFKIEGLPDVEESAHRLSEPEEDTKQIVREVSSLWRKNASSAAEQALRREVPLVILTSFVRLVTSLCCWSSPIIVTEHSVKVWTGRYAFRVGQFWRRDLIWARVTDASKRREKLQKAFKEFCDHRAERFWAEHNLQVSSEITAKQAEVISQRVGIKQSEIAYDRYFSSANAKKPSSGPVQALPMYSADGTTSVVSSTSVPAENSVSSKRSAAEVVPEVDESMGAPSHEPPHKKVAFLEVEFPLESESDYVDSNPSSARSSLNSIDFRFIDHLVGPGTSSSRLTTKARLIIDQVDVSELLLNARRSVVKKQYEITDVSDLLELKLLFDCSVFAASHTFQVGDLDVLDHWSQDPLPTPAGFEEAYYPDYFAEYDGFPLLIVDIKKSGANDDDLEEDQRILPCMQKLMIDRMLDAGVMAPIVVGFLIRCSRCEISLMSLDHEALYVVKSIGAFELPRNNLQLALLCPGLGPLQLAHEVVLRTLTAIKARDSNCSMRAKWRRPSYYVEGNRIPTPKAVIDEDVDPTATKAQ